MPTYTFDCPTCNLLSDYILPMSESQSTQKCLWGCETPATRLILIPQAIVTDTNFGEGDGGGHYNVQTGTDQTRAEWNKWAGDKKKAAAAQGRECHIGEKSGSGRDSRGEQIADDVARHGAPAMEHYKVESKRKAAEAAVAKGQSVS